MASITIHNIDEYAQHRQNALAEARGCPVEEVARDVQHEKFLKPRKRPRNLAAAIRSKIEPLGGVELELPPRD